MSKKVSAILLSRPLGQGRTPKMLLPFGEDTVLSRTLKAYRGFDEVLVVVPGTGEGVESAIRSSGVSARAAALHESPVDVEEHSPDGRAVGRH